VAVLPEARSGGLGTALMEAALEAAEAEGATAIAVGVAHSNADAIRWYEREGFEPFYVTLLRR
jgi:ribosomal protein S18 acetylase RimI-like enzyme